MYEFPFELDDFQKDACRCITDGKSVVVCAPTGAGITVIAQHAMDTRNRLSNYQKYASVLGGSSVQVFDTKFKIFV